MTDDSDLLTTPRAASAVGVARSTLWRWLKLGWITPHSRTIGGHLRWDLDELRAQIDRMHQQQAALEDYVPEPASSPEHQPVVAAIVTSELGVLAGRRNDGKPPWTFIAGEIEPGESPADAAVREVKEETGLRVRSGHRPIGRRVHPKTGRTMIYLACSPTEGLEVHVGDEDELAEVRWLSLAEVDDLMPGVFEPVREHLDRVLR